MAKVLGVDPSLTGTGIAYIDAEYAVRPIRQLVKVGHSLKKDSSLFKKSERMNLIEDRIYEAAAGFGVDLVVIEGLSFGSVGAATRDLAGLWWTIVNRLQKDGYEVAIASPQQRAKYATGDGRAAKDVVVAHVVERYQDLSVDKIADDNMADALVLAAMGARHLGCPIEATEPPVANLAAMEALSW